MIFLRNTILIVAGMIFIGVVGVFIGTRLSGRISFPGPFNAGRRVFAPTSRMQEGFRQSFGKGTLQGQITKIDGNQVTIQRADGTSYTVTIDDNTSVDKETKGAKEDLQTGQNVTVYGSGSPSGYKAGTIVISP